MEERQNVEKDGDMDISLSAYLIQGGGDNKK